MIESKFFLPFFAAVWYAEYEVIGHVFKSQQIAVKSADMMQKI